MYDSCDVLPYLMGPDIRRGRIVTCRFTKEKPGWFLEEGHYPVLSYTLSGRRAASENT